MPGNLTPPILTEAVHADQGSAGSRPSAGPGFPPDADSVPDGEGEASPSLPQAPRDAHEDLRLSRSQTAFSDLDLIERHQRRERELKARFDQAQQIIESGRLELAHVQKLQDEQRAVMLLQQEQHQTQLRELQASLSAARQDSERSQGDLHGLRQRCAQLQQDCDHRQHRIDDLEQALQAAREQLGSQGAELQAMQQRCETLEREREELERASASRHQELEAALESAREQLGSQGAELQALQQRCESLEQEGSEQASASRQHEQDRPQANSPAWAVPDGGMANADPETERLREELSALHHLLEELPEIYEHKFRQRLQPLLEQRDWLLHENGWLRAELLPAPQEPERPALPQASRRRGLLKSVQALLPLRLPGRRLQGSIRPARVPSGETDADHDLSDPDDGPPRAA